jgi:hypothetical protein
MFWRKKQTNHQTKPISVLQGNNPIEPTDRLDSAADNLASSLSAYSEAAWQRQKEIPNQDLIAAKQKIASARKIVLEGRIAYALGRCIPDHVKHWHAWIKREDFMNWVRFDATEISAHKETLNEGSRGIDELKVSFLFNQRHYLFVLRDKGYSYVPDSLDRLGEVELWFEKKLVAHFDVIMDISKDYSQWEFSDIQALSIGEWMKDIIDISMQIEARNTKEFESFSTERALNVAKKIEI